MFNSEDDDQVMRPWRACLAQTVAPVVRVARSRPVLGWSMAVGGAPLAGLSAALVALWAADLLPVRAVRAVAVPVVLLGAVSPLVCLPVSGALGVVATVGLARVGEWRRAIGAASSSMVMAAGAVWAWGIVALLWRAGAER